jgi:hypothetical protein
VCRGARGNGQPVLVYICLSSAKSRLSEDELQQTSDFCGKLFAPVTPDPHRATERRLAEGLKAQVTEDPNLEDTNPRFMGERAPVIHPQIIETAVQGQLRPTMPDTGDTAAGPRSDARMADAGCGELDMKIILENANATRVIYPEHKGIHNFKSLCKSSTWMRVWCMRQQSAHTGDMRTGRTLRRLPFGEPLSTPYIRSIEWVSR